MFTELGRMTVGEYCNVKGVVVDYMPPVRSKGSSFVRTVSMVDGSSDGKKYDVKMFSDAEGGSFKVEIGDIVEIYDIKLVRERVCVANNRSRMAVVSSIDDIRCNDSKENSLLSECYASYRKAYTKLRTIRNMRKVSYCDIVGEVTAIEHVRENLVLVCIVDHTEDPSIDPGPDIHGYKSTMVCCVKVWGNKISLISELSVGDIVLFKNLRVKDTREAITASMSESMYCNAIKLRSGNPHVRYLRSLEEEALRIAKRRQIISERFSSFELINLVDISGNGVHRVRARVVCSVPPFPLKFSRCWTCGVVSLGALKCSSSCDTRDESVCVLVLSDLTGEASVICKNNVLDALIDKQSGRIMCDCAIEALIVSNDLGGHQTYNYLIDINVER